MTTLNDFHNRVRILFNIDMDVFVGAGLVIRVVLRSLVELAALALLLAAIMAWSIGLSS